MLQVTGLTLQSVGLSEVVIGETWRVSVSFKYVVPNNITVTLQACPYTYLVGILNRVDSCCGQSNINLVATATTLPKEATVDIYFTPKGEGGIADGTYGLIVEILGTDAEAHIDDYIIVSGNPPSIWEMIGPLLIMGLMVGMMAMMKEGF